MCSNVHAAILRFRCSAAVLPDGRCQIKTVAFFCPSGVSDFSSAPLRSRFSTEIVLAFRPTPPPGRISVEKLGGSGNTDERIIIPPRLLAKLQSQPVLAMPGRYVCVPAARHVVRHNGPHVACADDGADGVRKDDECTFSPICVCESLAHATCHMPHCCLE